MCEWSLENTGAQLGGVPGVSPSPFLCPASPFVQLQLLVLACRIRVLVLGLQRALIGLDISTFGKGLSFRSVLVDRSFSPSTEGQCLFTNLQSVTGSPHPRSILPPCFSASRELTCFSRSCLFDCTPYIASGVSCQGLKPPPPSGHSSSSVRLLDADIPFRNQPQAVWGRGKHYCLSFLVSSCFICFLEAAHCHQAHSAPFPKKLPFCSLLPSR